MVQCVGDAMSQERMHARPAREDLHRGDAPRCGVTIVGGGDVAADLAGDAPQRAEAEHGTYDNRVRFLILHGWQGSGPEHWQTWLAGRLRGAGHHVQYPELPACDEPCPDRWGIAFRSELGRLAARQDDERVVVAHSLGCVLWLREAANIAPSRRVDRVALVAPPCPGAAVPELAGFYPTGAEREAVTVAARETRLVCTDNDPYCPGENAARFWAQPLELTVDLLPGAGHLNVDAGYGPWPEMEAWCLGERTALTERPSGLRPGGPTSGGLPAIGTA
jgi:predicted alpha/beta hydrolase family esterase